RRLARTIAAGALVALIGVGPPGGAVTPAGNLPEGDGGAAVPEMAALEERALGDRPLLAAAAARYRASEETLRAETAARWPWFRLAAAPRVRRHEFVGAPTDLIAGVDVTLPILDTNAGHVRAAEAARDRARAE